MRIALLLPFDPRGRKRLLVIVVIALLLYYNKKLAISGLHFVSKKKNIPQLYRDWETFFL